MPKTTQPIKKLSNVTALLPCKLTNDELLQAGQDLARINQDIVREEDDQTDAKAQMKARLTALNAKRTEISLKISRKAEERSVTIERTLDFDAGKYRETRTDTGEVINQRDIQDHERQESII
jgi:hypothetical protein